MHDDPAFAADYDDEITAMFYGGIIFATDVSEVFRHSLPAVLNMIPAILTAMDELCDEIKDGRAMRTPAINRVLLARRSLISALNKP